MLDIVIKSIVGGLIIGLVSSLAQKNPTFGAIIMGIPMVSFITLVIMYYSGVEYQTFKTFSYQTVYFVAISLIFFPLFVAGFAYMNFWIALLGSAAITAILFYFFYNFIV
mgnify:CR=1 FL=1|tara:strand:+ start:318 stop:647 length:330 start_codon:yes stop_codon:yes gene_type:complete